LSKRKRRQAMPTTITKRNQVNKLYASLHSEKLN
jgi:hypothetical protein